MNWIGRPMILILATGLGKGHTLQRFNYNKQYVMKEFLYRFVFANGGTEGMNSSWLFRAVERCYGADVGHVVI